MVTPLNVEIVEVAQHIHDFVRTGATVIDVAQEVEHVDGQLLDEVTHGNDEVINAMCRYDGLDNHVHIGLLVGIAAVLVQKLLDDVGEVLRQCLVNLGAAVFGRDIAAHLHQAVDGDEIPVVEVILVGDFVLDEFKFLGRIIDERAQVFLLTCAQ